MSIPSLTKGSFAVANFALRRFGLNKIILPAALLLLMAGVVSAAEPLHFKYLPPPPGTIAQSQLVYLSGEAMHGQWRGVVSRKAVGRDADENETFYQWYLTIYAIDSNGNYARKFQAPGKGTALLDVLEKAKGANLWFPRQTAEIVGTAHLMQPGVQQLVVAVHQTGADCGSATLTVFRFDRATQRVVPAVSLANGCQLDAKIVHEAAGDALRIDGPYYGPKAAMCCPTKPKASATLRYRDGKWRLAPAYYEMSVGKYAFNQ